MDAFTHSSLPQLVTENLLCAGTEPATEATKKIKQELVAQMKENRKL